MPTFAETKNQSDTPSLVKKALEGVVFMKRRNGAATIPDALFDAENQPIDLVTTGFWPVGIMSTDGITWGREFELSETEAWGYADFVRSDTLRAPKTLAFAPMESDRRQLAEIIYGMDLSGVTPGTNGAVTFDEPPMPSNDEYEAVVLIRDGSASNPYFRGAGVPRIKLSEMDEEVWQAEEARQLPLTFSVHTDGGLGTPMRHYIGGTAFDAAAQGFGGGGTAV